MWRASQNETRSENWRYEGAHRIEGLSNVEAAFSGFWGAEDGHVRIGRDLQEGLAAGHDEQSEKEQPVDSN